MNYLLTISRLPILSLILYFFLSGELLCQSNLNIYNNIGLKEGLSHSTINSIYEDNLGYLWFASQDGLNKYDGYNFSKFFKSNNNNSLLENWILQIYIDSFDQVWIYYQGGGISRYSPQENKFSHYKIDDNQQTDLKLTEQYYSGLKKKVFFEDNNQNIWVCSNSGARIYNRSTDSFNIVQDNSSSIIQSINIKINEFTEDLEKNIWIGTQSGIYKYDPKNKTYLLFSDDKTKLSDQQITCLKAFSDSTLWVGTLRDGLFVIKNPNSNNAVVKRYLDKSIQKDFDPSVFEIFQSSNGNVYVGHTDGLYVFTTKNNEYHDSLIIKSNKDRVYNFAEDHNKYLWVGMHSDHSFFRIKTLTNEVDKISSLNETGYKGEGILSLYISKTDVLWIGTDKGGVYKTNLNAKEFYRIDGNPSNSISISDKEVYGIFEDSDQHLYVGTKTDLNVINFKNNKTTRFYAKKTLKNNVSYLYSKDLAGSLIGVIKQDKDKNLWLGSYDNKVSYYNPKSRIFLNFHQNEKDSTSFKIWSVRAICITKNHDVYFGGTMGGLVKLEENNKTFKSYPIVRSHDHRGTNDFRINCIEEDTDGSLWIGTLSGGLNHFNKEKNEFEHFLYDPNNSHSISNNIVTSILVPQVHENEWIWIGTMNGLNKFNRKTKNFVHYTVNEGMPSNTIHGILEDNKGMLWLSTNNGIIKFDPITEEHKQYTIEDGLLDNEFNENAYFKSRKGILYFGGSNGITYFDPLKIKDNPHEPNIIVTGFKVFNKEINANDIINDRIILDTAVSYINSITLSHKEKVIAFEFSSLLYISDKKIRYKYKLQGFDDGWIEVGAEQRHASYTNLPSGKYIFMIKSTNSDGVWSSKIKKLNVEVLPPFWETKLFKLMVATLIFVLFIIILKLRTRALQRQKNNLELEVSKRTNDLTIANSLLKDRQLEILGKNKEIEEQRDFLFKKNNLLVQQKKEIQEISNKLHESDQQKIKFFTNISHEFRTPLTLMMAPTEKWIKRLTSNKNIELKGDLTLIYRNEKRLLNLINQLLEIRKIETNTNNLSVQRADIIAFINEIFHLFEPLADLKNINFSLVTTMKELIFFFDTDKVEKMMFNLLSNAFKYSEIGGKIEICIASDEKNDKVKISVFNKGKGISKEHLPFIFDRFYQMSADNFINNISSGIGLSLTKDLVEIHKGEIYVSSDENTGTTFTVFLPLSVNHYSASEISDCNLVEHSFDSTRSMLESFEEIPSEYFEDDLISDELFRILVVEDNIDMQRFLFNELSKRYSVIIASNGIEGIEVARNQVPDLIISDIMMPEMDGIKMSEDIKSNELTSHIPIFLLTAKSENKDQIEGFRVGIDDYIIKPFNIEVLYYRINNILKLRKQLSDKYKEGLNYIPANIKINKIDQDFLEKFIKIVEKNIDNSDLSGDQVAIELNMSKSSLYKKLKSLNGLSVNIFIRTIRLKVAAKLLKSGGYSISEIAYSVGFNNPKYFSTCFTEQFSIPPKEYAEMKD